MLLETLYLSNNYVYQIHLEVKLYVDKIQFCVMGRSTGIKSCGPVILTITNNFHIAEMKTKVKQFELTEIYGSFGYFNNLFGCIWE